MRKRLAALVCGGGLFLAGSAVTAGAAAPAVSLNATSLAFGAVAWQHDAPIQAVTITNTGDAPLAIQTVDISGQPFVPEDFTETSSSQPCAFTLAPGATCQVAVEFKPQSGGPRAATMTIWDNAADSPQSVSLSGTGTGAVVVFTPRFLDFGTVPVGTTSAPRTFWAVNSGDAPMTVSGVALDGPPSVAAPFAIAADACTGTTLAPGARCAVSATVTPNTVGLSEADLVDVFDDAGTGEQKYNGSTDGLNAFGSGPQAAILEPFDRSFHEPAGAASAPVPYRVYDSGTAPLQIASVGFDNPSAGFSVVHDGCSGTTVAPVSQLAPPSSCEVDVVFNAPSAVAQTTANLVIADNEVSGSHSKPLTGFAFAPGTTQSTTSMDFGFAPTGTPSAEQFVTLQNTTQQQLSMAGAIVSGPNASAFRIADDSCSGVTLAGGAGCRIGIVFTAPFPFLFTGTLNIGDNSPVIPTAVALRGEGATPAFTISSNRLGFGNQNAGTTSAAKTITVTNTSAGPLTFGFLGDATIDRSGCGGQVAGGGSCTVSVAVTPATTGVATGLLKIVDSSSDQQVVEVDWTGTTGVASLTDGVVNNLLVESVGATTTVSALVRNSGSGPLSIGQVGLTGAPPASITADGCSGQTLGVGSACGFTITSTPTQAGSYVTTIVVPSDTVGGPNPATLDLSGFVAPPTIPAFIPTSLAFPATLAGAESTQVVWYEDGLVPGLGAQAASISAVAVGGADAGAFRIVWDGCSQTIVDPAYSCPVEVGFDPTAGRQLSATLQFTDDRAGSPRSVQLTGLGLFPAATPSPSRVDFGSVTLKSKSAPLTVTLTSSGNFAVKVSRVSLAGPNKGDFTIVSESCQNQTLQPGGSCQVTLVFRPQALGARTATLTFTDTGLDSPQSVPLTGSGVSK